MLSFFAVLLSGFGFIHVAYAQGVDTSGGVDVDGSWYVGEGLKKGDYFSFRLCELDLNDCARFVMEIWVRGDVTKGSETLWDFETVVRDGSKIVKGEMQIGKIAPEPVGASENLFYYSRAYRSSIVWLSAFATDFRIFRSIIVFNYHRVGVGTHMLSSKIIKLSTTKLLRFLYSRNNIREWTSKDIFFVRK